MDEQVCFPRVKNTGLRGIPVADTKVSYIDGVKGELQYRGFLIQDLARYSTYEEVAHLLIHGALPTREELAAFDARLRASRALPAAVAEAMALRPKTAVPMDVLQGAVTFLADHDPELKDTSKDAVKRQAERLTARLPAVVAAWKRLREGKAPLEPRQDLSHAAHFLYLLKGDEPLKQESHIVDVCLTLHADHTFNASTFAAREVASTHAHLYASVAAAVGALSGELHGGANEQVMRMLQEIGTPDKAAAYVRAKLDAGKKVMGMGHAVYKTLDPRAPILMELALELGKQTGQSFWIDIAEAVREATQQEFRARKGLEIYPNVDFYSAATYFQLGIDTDLFTPVFALGRVAGWCAHVIEEKFAEAQEKPELYRPEAVYVGDYCGPQGCAWVPLGERNTP
ncbi:MAG: citrate/2-methylcitrate synthase [Deferrisomatales bacterium]|nr:citrate/2-methylcitrate synthase [Deferrisomatales bacterium]